jgi:tripartite ATP-independent transporter DctP family solute receptor
MPIPIPFHKLSPILLCAALAGCTAHAETTVIKLGHGLEPSHSVHLGMVFMADRVREKSGGRVRIDVYPSQQLGTERELIELLQIGSVGMTKVSAAVLESFVPAFRVFGIPYLFDDQAHRDRVLTSDIGKDLLRSTEPARVRGLCYYDSGTRSFYTRNRPVHTPDDLAGLKIRTQESATAMRMVQALGGSPTPIAWGELYTALQQGVVDGAENNPPSFYLSRHYEVCRYYTLDEHTTVPDVLLISRTVWEDLSADEQRWLQEAADESFVYQLALWQESTEDSLRGLQAAGVEIIYPDKAPFVERVQPLHQEFRRDPEMRDLMDRIEALRHDPGPARPDLTAATRP